MIQFLGDKSQQFGLYFASRLFAMVIPSQHRLADHSAQFSWKSGHQMYYFLYTKYQLWQSSLRAVFSSRMPQASVNEFKYNVTHIYERSFGHRCALKHYNTTMIITTRIYTLWVDPNNRKSKHGFENSWNTIVTDFQFSMAINKRCEE